jgi:hypothetical protein
MVCQPSEATVKRLIEREGKRWGLAPMLSVFDYYLVAEDQPCMIPLTENLAVLERVRRDITRLSDSYPFSSVLGNRFDYEKRQNAMSREIYHARKLKEAQKPIEEAKEELAKDLRNLAKGRKIITL